MIKLIITDIGGVLVKTDKAIIQCIKKVFQENNIPLGSKKDLLSAFGVSIFDYIKNYLPKEHKDKADFCYNEFKKIYPLKVIHVIKVFPDINKTLYFLKERKLQIGVLSCRSKNEVKVNLSLLKFKDFDIIFSLEDYKYKRPLPNGLIRIMNKLKILPNETVYVGDTINDIKMAKNAKVTSIAVKTGAQENKQLEQAQPDYLLEDFSKIKEIIDKL